MSKIDRVNDIELANPSVEINVFLLIEVKRKKNNKTKSWLKGVKCDIGIDTEFSEDILLVW